MQEKTLALHYKEPRARTSERKLLKSFFKNRTCKMICSQLKNFSKPNLFTVLIQEVQNKILVSGQLFQSCA